MNLKELFANKYDYVLFSDGSASTIDTPGAFGLIAFSKDLQEYTRQNGFLRNCTVNQAEILGTISFLAFLDAKKELPKKILVCSDSEVTVKCGNREYERNFNLGYWAFVDEYLNKGSVIDFMWFPRNSNKYLKWCDKISKNTRIINSCFLED